MINLNNAKEIISQYRVPYDLLDNDKYWVQNELPNLLYTIATNMYNPREKSCDFHARFNENMELIMNIYNQSSYTRHTVRIKEGSETIEFTPITINKPLNNVIGIDTLFEVKILNIADYIINCIRTRYFRKTVQEYEGLKEDFDEFVKYTNDRILLNKSVFMTKVEDLKSQINYLKTQIDTKQSKQSIFDKLFKRGE